MIGQIMIGKHARSCALWFEKSSELLRSDFVRVRYRHFVVWRRENKTFVALPLAISGARVTVVPVRQLFEGCHQGIPDFEPHE